MALTSSATLSISSSSSLVDAKVPRQSVAGTPQCVTFPTHQNRPWKATACCRKMSRSVVVMATGEAPAEVDSTEGPDIVKTVQETWDKVEDKYAVSSLIVAGAVVVWVSAGMISAIDRLPLIPGILELVGMGSTGWFVYKNIIFKPEREALIEKIKVTFEDIIGTS